jgi:hypothetical protein
MDICLLVKALALWLVQEFGGHDEARGHGYLLGLIPDDIKMERDSDLFCFCDLIYGSTG